MSRSKMLFGLILFGALVIAAIAALTAQAEGEKFTAAKYPVTVSGTGEWEFNYGEPLTTEKCKIGTLDATLKEASTTMEFAPTFEGCTAAEAQIKTTMNGCMFKKKPKENLGADKYKIISELVCPPGKVMEKHRPLNCTVTIAPQEMGFDVFEDDTAAGKTKVILEVTSFTYTLDQGLGCPTKGGVYKAKSIKGTLTLSAQDSEGHTVTFDVG